VKRLIALSLLEPKQLEELRALLRESGIECSETAATLFSSGALWVQEQDLARARELLSQESAAFAARAREEWEREWREEHGSSGLRWLVARLRANPVEMLAALALLALLVWLLVLYPLYYLLQRLA
jgi:hypothetical protein